MPSPVYKEAAERPWRTSTRNAAPDPGRASVRMPYVLRRFSHHFISSAARCVKRAGRVRVWSRLAAFLARLAGMLDQSGSHVVKLWPVGYYPEMQVGLHLQPFESLLNTTRKVKSALGVVLTVHVRSRVLGSCSPDEFSPAFRNL